MNWSAATFRDGYATDVESFSSKEEAFEHVLDYGPTWYAIQGIQMWNEPMGQVEEHDRPAKVIGYDSIKRAAPKPQEAQAPADIKDDLYEVASMGEALMKQLVAEGDTEGDAWSTATRMSGLYNTANRAKLVPYASVRPARRVDLLKARKLLQGVVKVVGSGRDTYEGKFVDEADDVLRRLKGLKMAARIAARFIQKLADQQPGQRKHVRELVTPINKPKGISPEITKDYGESKSQGDNITIPAKQDIRPMDVFNPSPKDVGVLNLVETGKDLSRALDKQIPKDKGHGLIDNLSEYLLRTQGGGEGGPEGKKL